MRVTLLQGAYHCDGCGAPLAVWRGVPQACQTCRPSVVDVAPRRPVLRVVSHVVGVVVFSAAVLGSIAVIVLAVADGCR